MKKKVNTDFVVITTEKYLLTYLRLKNKASGTFFQTWKKQFKNSHGAMKDSK